MMLLHPRDDASLNSTRTWELAGELGQVMVEDPDNVWSWQDSVLFDGPDWIPWAVFV